MDNIFNLIISGIAGFVGCIILTCLWYFIEERSRIIHLDKILLNSSKRKELKKYLRQLNALIVIFILMGAVICFGPRLLIG